MRRRSLLLAGLLLALCAAITAAGKSGETIASRGACVVGHRPLHHRQGPRRPGSGSARRRLGRSLGAEHACRLGLQGRSHHEQGRDDDQARRAAPSGWVSRFRSCGRRQHLGRARFRQRGRSRRPGDEHRRGADQGGVAPRRPRDRRRLRLGVSLPERRRHADRPGDRSDCRLHGLRCLRNRYRVRLRRRLAAVRRAANALQARPGERGGLGASRGHSPNGVRSMGSSTPGGSPRAAGPSGSRTRTTTSSPVSTPPLPKVVASVPVPVALPFGVAVGRRHRLGGGSRQGRCASTRRRIGSPEA